MPYDPTNNPYLPGDPYSYDLKWMVSEIKRALAMYDQLEHAFGEVSDQVDEFTDTMTADFQALHDYVYNYFANLDVSDEINAKLDEMAQDGTLDALLLPYFNAYKAEINGIVAQQNDDIDVLEARMDTFASLPAGSTAGNAELLDIRVGTNGATYPSAGDAVRGQIGQLETAVDTIFDYARKSLSYTITPGSYVDSSGNVTANVNMSYLTAAITSDDLCKNLYIDGIAWYAIKPWVYVDSDSTVTASNVPEPGSTVTQYSEQLFIPEKTGTLYINLYTAYYGYTADVYEMELNTVKDTALPDPLPVKDVVVYELEALTMINDRFVNGNTGEITDASGNNNYRISDYVDVEGKARIMLSTEHHWQKGLYAFYDNEYRYITGAKAEPGGTVTQIRNEVINVPLYAKYLVIGFYYQASFPSPILYLGGSQNCAPTAIWKGLKWACMGDSLTASYSVTGVHYFEYIRALTGIATVNLGKDGCGYAKGSGNFMTQALQVPADSDVVTIFGSGNDASAGLPLGTATDTGTSTIAGCINTTIDNIYTILPVVNLGIVTPTPWKGNMPYNNGWMETYAALIVEICKLRSIPCLDLYHESNLDPNSADVRSIAYVNDSTNGVHPSEIGHQMIAAQFKAFLQKLILR